MVLLQNQLQINMKKTALCIGLILSIAGVAQQRKLSYTPSNLPVFINKSGDTLSKALIGGLNQPQFQAIDLNNDGKKDLVIHDRSGGIIVPYINKGNNDITKYEYSPNYVSAFPKIDNAWFLLVDYDNDGKEDLWTKINFRTVLFRNVTKAGDKKVKFAQISSWLVAYNFGQPPLDSNSISCDNFNIPTIADVDGDGDVDIFSYQANEGNLLLYRNMTVDFKLPISPPVFELADFCWGSFIDTAFDGVRVFPCTYKIYRKHGGGSTLLWFDNDDDGDMDLLMGNAGGPNLIYLENGKKDFNTTYDSIIRYNGNWPANTTPVNIKSFAGAFMLDADGDGVKDILVAPNQTDKSYFYEETEQVWFYKNTGTNKKPIFKFEKKNYFTDELLDHGSYTDPVLYDIDNDQDLDLIIASNGDYAKTRDQNYRLILYRNIGTKTKPVFKLENEDIWGLSNDSIQFLSVSFGDLNGDGKPDMVAGNYFGSLYFYKNIGTSTTWAFTTPIKNYGGVRVGGERSTPQIIDLDKDGLLDLVIGEKAGNFNYFRNTGNTTNPVFTAVDDTLGTVFINEVTGRETDGTPIYYWIGDASGEISDLDNDGKYDLIGGGDEGKIKCYKFETYNQLKYKEDTTILFDSAYMRYSTSDFGAQTRPAVGDLDGDGVKDLIIGNNRGGINFLKGSVTISSVNALRKNAEPSVYPNPNNGQILNINKKSSEQFIFSLYDLSGRLVQYETSAAGTETYQMKLNSISDGIYILQSSGTDNTNYFTRVMVFKK